MNPLRELINSHLDFDEVNALVVGSAPYGNKWALISYDTYFALNAVDADNYFFVDPEYYPFHIKKEVEMIDNIGELISQEHSPEKSKVVFNYDGKQRTAFFIPKCVQSINSVFEVIVLSHNVFEYLTDEPGDVENLFSKLKVNGLFIPDMGEGFPEEMIDRFNLQGINSFEPYKLASTWSETTYYLDDLCKELFDCSCLFDLGGLRFVKKSYKEFEVSGDLFEELKSIPIIHDDLFYDRHNKMLKLEHEIKKDSYLPEKAYYDVADKRFKEEFVEEVKPTPEELFIIEQRLEEKGLSLKIMEGNLKLSKEEIVLSKKLISSSNEKGVYRTVAYSVFMKKL